MSLIKQTSISFFWNFLEQFLRRGIGIGITLVLAWFLIPEDYGLIAMMAVFLSISSLIVEGGIGQALIRKLDVTQLDYSTAFYANIVLAVFAYGMLFLLAPWIAAFYGENLLVSLIRVSGLSILFGSLVVVQDVILSRELRFKLKLKIALPSSVIAGVIAIFLAYMGYGVWALVTQMITSSILTALLYWRLKIWRPSPEFSWSALKTLFGFGGYLFTEQLLSVLFNNLYVVVIAKTFLSSTAGFYFFSEKIKDLVIHQVVNSIESVTYPALAKLQSDNIKLKEGYRKITQVTTFLFFPVMALLAALAEPLFQTILPVKWLPAALYLQLMCIAATLYPLHSINLNILKVKGRADIILYLGVYKKLVMIGVFIIALKFGVIGILVGQIVSSILAYIPNSYFSAKRINYSMLEQIMDFVSSFMLSSLIAGLVYGAVYWFKLPHLTEFILFGSMGGVAYLGGAYLLKMKGLNVLMDVVKSHRLSTL